MNSEEKLNKILENQELIIKEIELIEEVLKSLLVNNICTDIENAVNIREKATVKESPSKKGIFKDSLVGGYARAKSNSNCFYNDINGMAISIENNGRFYQWFCLNYSIIIDYDSTENKVLLQHKSNKYSISVWFDLNDIELR